MYHVGTYSNDASQHSLENARLQRRKVAIQRLVCKHLSLKNAQAGSLNHASHVIARRNYS